MIVPVSVIVVPVNVDVPPPVIMFMFVFMKRNFERALKRIGNTAERGEAWQVLAAFQARNHGFRHPKSCRKLPLGFATLGTQSGELVRKTLCESNRWRLGACVLTAGDGPSRRRMGDAPHL